MRKTIYTIMFLMSFSLLAKPAVTDNAVYKGNPSTIAHDFINLEKQFGTGPEHYAIINNLINKAISRITVKKNYSTEEAVKIMMLIDILLKDEGFKFKNNFLFSEGIKNKTIDCDNYCALYISIAEVMKIPIVPVYAPNHSFLRFYFDDGSYLNWEPLESKPLADSYYINKFKISEKSISEGVYMKTLTKKEFLAVEHNNIGAYFMSVQKYNNAISSLNAAIKINPGFSSAYHNRGTSYYALKRLKEAQEDLLKANDLDPDRALTHNTLGDIYMDNQDYDNALKEFNIAIQLDPENYVPFNNIALIYKIRGKEKDSQIWFKKSLEVKSKYVPR